MHVIPANAGIQCLGRSGPWLEFTPVKTGAGVTWPHMTLGLRRSLVRDELRHFMPPAHYTVRGRHAFLVISRTLIGLPVVGL